ncbi:hypothetical protein PAECIP111893_00008 [Paenibacillus plantiphilus]|uniref:Molecular chaperone n=1 Tax=Paenibacillus plantiphilus TaxID=2905650 RepID=A0ABN8FS84_9BACL|nr:molecular chaperone [Paenibacillus plantiphilus]CAH1189910.1 hypothetical protein PAECIP111893_00008 [Paenibacillus plantiphilus]
MGGYSYRLYRDGASSTSNSGSARFRRAELEEMTTYQLRNICQRERLIEGLVQSLDQEEMIRTILKFRNAEESLLIRKPSISGLEQVEQAIGMYLNTPLKELSTISIPAKIVLYNGLCTNKRDGYGIEGGPVLTESNVLLVNENGELCGILNAVKDGREPGVYCLYKDKDTELRRTTNRNYSLLFFRKQDSDYLYKAYYAKHPMPPINLHYGRVDVAELEIRELEQTSAVLAVDFGTSNTTAGVYLDSSYVSSHCSHDLLSGKIRLNEINYVSFFDATEEETLIEMLPTVASVDDCSDPSLVQYLFGYDALKAHSRNGYSGHATVFRGMKRWVNGYDKMEEVSDPRGNAAQVKRSDIIRAYLLHVIGTAEHQFKCRFRGLHLTSPVKLKKQFLEMFVELLPEYEIECDQALDEGMAVLYNTIANQMEKNGFTDGDEYQALVIDCGGGTTDVSSCRFRIEDGHISYKINIETSYENGDTNFGGNNLTYRIMQYMKIVFASYYSRGAAVTDIDTLIDIPGTDLFRHVDEYGIDAVYEMFDRRYREAEAILPTRYKEYENRARDDYRRVRGNFYFLWEIAERMKMDFFRRTGTLRSRFLSESDSGAENDLRITAVERWCLSVRDQDRFRDIHECPNVVFTIKEMTQLVKADIYEIVRKFLDEFYRDGRLQNYSIIKLTGQSCRIDVFREALKEFVPGRSIEFRQKAEPTGLVPELKLACLRGAIRYGTALKAGYIETSITDHAPIIPYEVAAYTHNRREKTLMTSLDRKSQPHGAISRPVGASEVEFHLKGSDGTVRQTYIYLNRIDQYKPMLYEDIRAIYGSRIPQDETDSIINGEAKFFVAAGESRWGFEVVPVARIGDQLHLGKKRFFAFENDNSELDFFDGLK